MRLIQAIMALTVIWNVFGLSTNFFSRTWKNASVPVTAIAYLLNSAWIAYLGFAYAETSTAFTFGAILGGAMFVWSAAGVLLQLKVKSDVRFISWLPGYAGAGIAAISGLIVMLLSVQKL